MSGGFPTRACAATLFVDEPNVNQTALVAPNLVAFLPWLRLKEPQTIGGYDFTPYRDREVRPNFAAVSKELELIFSRLSGVYLTGRLPLLNVLEIKYAPNQMERLLDFGMGPTRNRK